jgi:hypothetical protein
MCTGTVIAAPPGPAQVKATSPAALSAGALLDAGRRGSAHATHATHTIDAICAAACLAASAYGTARFLLV